MADQELSIQINTNAKKAVNGLDQISESMKRIESTLSGISGALGTLANIGRTTSKAINKLADTIRAVHPERFNELSKAIKNSAQAAEKTGEALKKTAQGAETAEQAISRVAKNIADSFGIKGKKSIDAITESVRKYYDAIKTFKGTPNQGQSDKYWENLLDEVHKTRQGVNDTVGSFLKLKIGITDTEKALLEYIQSTNRSGSKIGLGENIKDFVDDFVNMRKVLGSAFVKGRGDTEFDTYIKGLNTDLHMAFSDIPQDAFRQLVEAVTQARNGLKEYATYLSEGQTRTREFNNAVEECMDGLAQMAMAEGKAAKAAIQEMTPAIEEARPAVEGFGNALYNAFTSTDGATYIDGINQSLSQMPPAISNVQNALGALGGTSLDLINEEFQSVTGSIEQKCLPAVISFQDALMQMAANGSAAMGGDILQRIADIAFQMDSAASSSLNFAQTLYMLSVALTSGQTSLNAFESGLSRIYEAFDNVFSRESPFKDWTFPHGWSKPLLEDSGIIDTEFKEIEKDNVIVLNGFQLLKEGLADLAHKSISAGSALVNMLVNVGAGVVKTFTSMSEIMSMLDSAPNRVISGFKMLGSVAMSVAADTLGRMMGIVGAPFAAIGKVVEAFGEKVQNIFAKMQSGWARVMRTFKFMIVRKAITAVIKNINEAMKSLARFDEETGHRFNQSMSLLISDFKYLGASIVGAFAPIINAVVPYIDALIEKLVEAINTANQFFAALTGSNKYTVAKKVITDYADAADDATEAQKELNKQLAAFDKLNILTTGEKNKKNAAVSVEWDEKKVNTKIKDFADQMNTVIKTIGNTFKNLFEPMKAAWEVARDHVLTGFSTLFDGAKKLASQIGSDFMTMWKEKETQQIFENLLHAFGSLEESAGIMAGKLADALDVDDRGLRIWESLRDIVLVLSEHLNNMGEATLKWAQELDLNPIVEATADWLESLKQVADFIGGIGEDIYTKIILPFASWTIETGIPELMKIFTDFNNTVDWDGLRDHLSGVWEAVEKFGEHVGEGLLAFIDGMVDAVANFINSDTFTDFLDFLAEMIPKIDFKNVGEGIAQAISSIAEGLASFVFIPAFEAFIRFIVWFSNQRPERIAEEIKLVAEAIIAIKLGQFTSAVVAQFKLFSEVVAGTLWAPAAKGLSLVASAIRGVVAAVAGWEIGSSLASILRNEHMAADQTLKDFEDIRLATHGMMRDATGEIQEASDEVLRSFGLMRDESKKIPEILAFTEEGAEAIKKYGNNVVGAVDVTEEHIWGNLNNISKAVKDANEVGENYATDTAKNFKDVDMAVHNAAGNVSGEMETISKSMGETSDSVVETEKTMQNFYASLSDTSNVEASLIRIPPVFRGAFKSASESMDSVLSHMEKSVESFVNNTAKNLEGLPSTFRGAFTSANDTIENVLSRTGGYINTFASDANNALAEISPTFTGVFQTAGTYVDSILSRLSSSISSFAKKAIDSLNNVLSKLSKVSSKIGGSSRVVSAPSSPESEVFEVPRYASGGFVSNGQIFVARENGIAEMVGSMGGRTAVANNDQIVSGIAQGVYSAVRKAMMDGGMGGDTSDIVIQIDGREIYRAVRRQDMDFRQQTGFSGFAYL